MDLQHCPTYPTLPDHPPTSFDPKANRFNIYSLIGEIVHALEEDSPGAEEVHAYEEAVARRLSDALEKKKRRMENSFSFKRLLEEIERLDRYYNPKK